MNVSILANFLGISSCEFDEKLPFAFQQLASPSDSNFSKNEAQNCVEDFDENDNRDILKTGQMYEYWEEEEEACGNNSAVVIAELDESAQIYDQS